MHQARQCQWRSETVIRCGLTPDLDARSAEIALWMFDAAACGTVVMRDVPVVNTEALQELRILLRTALAAKARPTVQAEQPEQRAPGDAHVDHCQTHMSGDATVAARSAQ